VAFTGDGETLAQVGERHVALSSTQHVLLFRWFGPAELREGGFEKQMFEYPKCAFTETVTDPIKSEAIRRSTENVRPRNEAVDLGCRVTMACAIVVAFPAWTSNAFRLLAG
jgi:hypothetical protein